MVGALHDVREHKQVVSVLVHRRWVRQPAEPVGRERPRRARALAAKERADARRACASAAHRHARHAAAAERALPLLLALLHEHLQLALRSSTVRNDALLARRGDAMLGVNVRERLELLADGALHRVALEKVAVDLFHLVAMRHGARRVLAARSVHEHGGGSNLQPLLLAGGGGGSRSRGRYGAARCGGAWCRARYARRRLRPRQPRYTARRARLPTGGGGGRGRTTKSSDHTRTWHARERHARNRSPCDAR
mmetsp:Transcript_56047/g.134302  ORF Transcript_56047/g.134302 Transcript_56047/m.134302 type:complete len:251 (+) Transcript_56047:1942-2694(+)